jgi:hypothetical protein
MDTFAREIMRNRNNPIQGRHIRKSGIEQAVISADY